MATVEKKISWADITDEEEIKKEQKEQNVWELRKIAAEKKSSFVCRECKKTKVLSKNFMELLKKNNWTLPKECKECKTVKNSKWLKKQ
jgi:hypothetical protein